MAEVVNNSRSGSSKKKKKKKKIETSDFQLSSTWQCTMVHEGADKPTYKFMQGSPTTSVHEVTFKYSLPSGSKIKKSLIYATLGSPKTGCSICSANDVPLKTSSGKTCTAKVKLEDTSAKYKVKFKFKANGKIEADSNRHSAVQTFKNVYLYIEYEEGSGSSGGGGSKRKFTVPKQCACIYDPKNNGVYIFDGVVKIQHSISVKLEEEPSKKKEEFVNNARNEPDKVVLDVRMSDVYSGDSSVAAATKLTANQKKAFNKAKKALIDSRSTRSTSMYQTMHWLKEERRKLVVITSHYIYVDMIIASITVNQDENSPFGWEGQITFQGAYKVTPPKKTRTGRPTSNDPPPTNANVAEFTNPTGGDTTTTAG